MKDSQETKPEVPKGKETVLGLYVTAKEAYEKWQADSEKVKILDVRTPEEYIFVGHAEMAVSAGVPEPQLEQGKRVFRF